MHKTQLQIPTLLLSVAGIWFMPNECPKRLVTLKCSRLLVHVFHKTFQKFFSFQWKWSWFHSIMFFVHFGIGVFQPAILAFFNISFKNNLNCLHSSQKPWRQLRTNLLKCPDLKYSNMDWFIKVLSKYFFKDWFYLGILPLPRIVRSQASRETQGFSTGKWKPVVILTGLGVPLSRKVSSEIFRSYNWRNSLFNTRIFCSLAFTVRPLATLMLKGSSERHTSNCLKWHQNI